VHPLLLMLCSFGLLPLCTVYLLRYHRGTLWTEDLFTRFCVVYGALSFLVAPLLGHTVERLFLYAWPIFLLATPVAMAQVFGPMADRRGLWLRLAAIHVATVGLGVMIFQVRDQATWQLAWSLTACVAAANVAAWWMLRRLELARSA
jgi:hypothetical protein